MSAVDDEDTSLVRVAGDFGNVDGNLRSSTRRSRFDEAAPLHRFSADLLPWQPRNEEESRESRSDRMGLVNRP